MPRHHASAPWRWPDDNRNADAEHDYLLPAFFRSPVAAGRIRPMRTTAADAGRALLFRDRRESREWLARSGERESPRAVDNPRDIFLSRPNQPPWLMFYRVA